MPNEKNFLLTYSINGQQGSNFDWFETEEQMQQFAATHDIMIFDSLEVRVIRDDVIPPILDDLGGDNNGK